MDDFNQLAFIEAYKRLKTGAPQPGDEAIVRAARDALAAQGDDTTSLDAVLGSAIPEAAPPDTRTNWLEELNREGGIMHGPPTADWAGPLAGAIGPAPVDQGAGGTVRIPELTVGGTTIGETAIPQGSQTKGGFIPPGARNLEGYQGAGPPPAWRTTEDVTRAEPLPPTQAPNAPPPAGGSIEDFISTVGGYQQPSFGPSEALTEAAVAAGATPSPEREDRRQRRADRGGRPPASGARDPVSGMPIGSAFAGIEAGNLPTVEANPEIAAEFLARARGRPGAGSVMAPYLEQLMNLNQTGFLGGDKKGLGGYESPSNRLAAAESLYNEMGPGSYLDPQKLHRATVRNMRRSDPADMWANSSQVGGESGDINNQIAVSNGALMAAASASMTVDSAAAIQARLEKAGSEYIMGVVDGSIIPSELSYPEWLRTEKRVRKWVGPGTTLEQMRGAFTPEE